MKTLAASHPSEYCQYHSEDAHSIGIHTLRRVSQQVMAGGKKKRTQTMPTGPAGIENASVDAMDGKRPIILNATAKI
jgi:hypothetical protein